MSPAKKETAKKKATKKTMKKPAAKKTAKKPAARKPKAARKPTPQQEYAALFSAGQLARLAAEGRDVLEGRREGAHLHDTAGRRYLDGDSSAGVFNLGRRHPALIAELRQAMHETDQGNFPMVSCEKAALARALAAFTPGNLECTVYSVVRGEALEFACKLARGYTGRSRLLAADGGWYGQTGFAVSLSDRPDRASYGPLMPDVGTLPLGDEAALKHQVTEQTAAVILEPVQAENHCRMTDGRYLQALRRRCTQTGTPLVFDETQTGLGRTGRRLAGEHFGVVPDALILGEALGGGLFPICATVFTQELNSWLNKHPMIHLSTFGGSDLGCRVAARALELYEHERPWESAAARGAELAEALAELQRRHAGVLRSVAGMGLLRSLELADAEQAKACCRRAAAHGLLVTTGRVATHTVLLRPSLLIGAAEVQEIVTAIDAALTDLAAGRTGARR